MIDTGPETPGRSEHGRRQEGSNHQSVPSDIASKPWRSGNQVAKLSRDNFYRYSPRETLQIKGQDSKEYLEWEDATGNFASVCVEFTTEDYKVLEKSLFWDRDLLSSFDKMPRQFNVYMLTELPAI